MTLGHEWDDGRALTGLGLTDDDDRLTEGDGDVAPFVTLANEQQRFTRGRALRFEAKDVLTRVDGDRFAIEP